MAYDAHPDAAPPPVPPPNLIEGEQKVTSMLSQFFLVPMLIAVTAVAIFVGVKMMTNDEKDPVRLVDEIRLEHGSSRWQLAYDLNSRLIRDPKARQDPRLVAKILQVFRELEPNPNQPRNEDDARTRTYLITILGTLRNPAAVPLILQTLHDRDGSCQVAAIQAAAALGDPVVIPDLLEFSAGDDAGLRKVAVFALGCFAPKRRVAEGFAPLSESQNKEVHDALRRVHHDRVSDVRWNAALALARYGDMEALPTLKSMLDRPYLESVAKDPATRMTEEMMAEVMVNAMKGMLELRDGSLKSLLENIRANDRSMEVRQAAGEVLNAIAS